MALGLSLLEGPVTAGLDAIGIDTPASIGAKKADDLLVPSQKVKLSKLISDAGWTGQDAMIARAVAMAESGGKSDAVGRNTNGTLDVGLFQMNSVHKGKFGSPADVDGFTKYMKNPQNNVKAAHSLFTSGGWTPWVTYNTGAYKRFLNGKDPDITTDKGTLTGKAQDAVSGPLEALVGILSALVDPSTWLRVGKGLLGGLVLVLGVAGMVLLVANKVRTP